MRAQLYCILLSAVFLLQFTFANRLHYKQEYLHMLTDKHTKKQYLSFYIAKVCACCGT